MHALQKKSWQTCCVVVWCEHNNRPTNGNLNVYL